MEHLQDLPFFIQILILFYLSFRLSSFCVSFLYPLHCWRKALQHRISLVSRNLMKKYTWFHGLLCTLFSVFFLTQSAEKVMKDKKDCQPFLSDPSGTRMLYFLPLLSILKISIVFPALCLLFIFLIHMQLSACLLSTKKCLFDGVSSNALKHFLTQSSVSEVISIEKDLW